MLMSCQSDSSTKDRPKTQKGKTGSSPFRWGLDLLTAIIFSPWSCLKLSCECDYIFVETSVRWIDYGLIQRLLTEASCREVVGLGVRRTERGKINLDWNWIKATDQSRYY